MALTSFWGAGNERLGKKERGLLWKIDGIRENFVRICLCVQSSRETDTG